MDATRCAALILLALVAAGSLRLVAIGGQEPPLDALVQQLDDDDASVRRDAAKALGELGPAARTAVPALLRVANRDKDRTVAEAAVNAIVKVGEVAIPDLVAALGKSRAMFGWAAGTALARIGPPAVPALIDLLEQSDLARARWEAVNTLRLICGRNDAEVRRQALSALSTVLVSDDSPEIRAEAAQAIGLIGAIGFPEVDEAIPVLFESVTDENADVRAAIVVAIGRIERELPHEASGVLLALARDREAVVRGAAARAIAHVVAPADAVPVLAGLLKDPKIAVRRAALRGLADLGPEARPAIADVEGALKSNDRRARLLAAEAVWKIDARYALALPVLIDVLEDRETPDRYHQDRLYAIRILGDMGPAAKPAIPALLGLLETNPPVGVVSGIRKAIEKIDVSVVPDAHDLEPS